MLPNLTPAARPASAASSSQPQQAPVSAAAPAAATAAAGAEPPSGESKEVTALRRKVQDIRVLLFRLADRLGQRGSIVNQVEYRISLAERIKLTNPRSPPVRRPSPFDAAR